MNPSHLRRNKLILAQFTVVLAAAMLILSHSPLRAQTYPTQIGVEADCRGAGPFVDLAKTLRQFTVIGTGGNTPMDANGWPTTDGETVLMDDRPLPAWAPPIDDPAGYQPDESGVYNCAFNGQATLAVGGGSPITLANQSYNSGTNTTTFTFTLPSGTWTTAPALVVLDFTNTKRTSSSGTNTGITNLQCIRPGYPAGSTQLYTNQFTSAFAPFDHVRYMEFKDTNYSAGYYGDPGHHLINWTDRGLTTDAFQDNQSFRVGSIGNAWEYVILLANQLNKDAWINIPITATGYNTTDTTSYIYQLALLFKNGDAATGGVGLKPGLHLYIEHSNEVWNFSFPQYTWNKLEAADAVAGTGSLGTTHVNSDGSTDQEVWAHRRHAERLYQIAQIFATVFGSGSLNTTIRPIYASWFIQPQSYFSDVLTWMNTQYGAPSNYFYAMAGAAYASETPTAGESVATILANMTANSDANVSTEIALRTVANNFGLKLYGYEGGPDNGGGSTTNIGNRILANRDPGITTLIEHDIRANYFGQGHADSYNFFNLSNAYSRYGSYGLSDDISNTSNSSPKWAAIYNLTGYNPGGAPAAPTSLTATSGNAQIVLNWTGSSGATSYNIYRGTAAGGENGTAIATGIAVASYTNTGLTNGTSYYYTVKAVNANGTSGASNEASATPSAPSAPSAPTGLTATAGNTQVSLTWNASSGATSYNVLRSAVSGSGYASVATGIATSSYTNTGLTNGTTYYFVVTATNSIGTSGNSNQASATPSVGSQTTLGDTDDRDAQSDVPAGTNPVISVSMWDQSYFKFSLSTISGTVTNAKLRLYRPETTQGSNTYSVYRTQNDTWVQSGTVPGLGTVIASVVNNAVGYIEWDVTSYVVGQMTGDKIASFGADSSSGAYTNYNTRENASNQPQLVITTNGGSIPAAPAGLTATGGNTQVALSWTASTGATSYNVKRSTVNGAGYATVSSPATTSYTNTGLTNGTAYYFVATAVNSSGESGNSNQASATPQVAAPPAPANLTATPGNGLVVLSWTASAGATSYTVNFTTGGNYTVAGNPTATTFTHTGLTNGTLYTYYVTATNAGGTSGASGTANATPTPTASTPFVTGQTLGGLRSDFTGWVGCQFTVGATPITVSSLGRWVVSGNTGTHTVKLVTASTGTDIAGGSVSIATSGAAAGAFKSVNLTSGITLAANTAYYIISYETAGGDQWYGDDTFLTTTTAATINNSEYWDTSFHVNTAGAHCYVPVNFNYQLASPPPAPAGLTATPGNAQVALSWTASTGATSYNVLRSTVSGSGYASVATGISTTSYTNTGLTNGTTYYFVVTATNSSGTSGNSNQASAAPTASTPFVTGQTLGSLRSDFTGWVGCQFTVGATPITVSSLGRWVVSGNTGTHTIKLVTASTGTDISGGSVTIATSGAAAGAFKTAALTSGVSLAANTAYYIISYETTGGDQWYDDNTFLTTTTAASINNSEYWDTSFHALTSGAHCYAPVISLYQLGGGSAPSAPAGLSAAPGNLQVALSWTASTGATSYNVYRGTAAGGESGTAIKTGVSTTSYTDTGLTNGQIYYYKVTAVNSSGESGKSNEASATPNGNTHTGTWALKGVFATTQTWNGPYEAPNVTANQTYTASFWMKGTGRIILQIMNGNKGSEITRASFTATANWAQYQITGIATGANTQLTYVLADGGGIAGTVYFDDCFLGVANGTNMLSNPGFESGNMVWGMLAPFTIVQNP